MRILLAEDDLRLGELIAHMLEKKGCHTVEWVTDGLSALDFALATTYDLLILDWMMPGKDGTDICIELRKKSYMGAILILTARDALVDRIEGLDAGADDYLVKPFEIGELLARVRALTRRNFAPIQEEEHEIAGMVLNRTNKTVSAGGKDDTLTVQLTPREFQLLNLLLQNSGITLTREVILDRIWGFDADVGPKTIDATVKLLRKKLSSFGNEELIQSIRGVGYKIEG
ncbi:response regulator transcription factor [Paenibacillus physcomitrellae]|uniref:DNA-binding response regulator n=1 Tax=Paenibacillus physcomitrellae TaxID=1619311 RepID=A0ABQ1GJU4_9BACL|nr:response regulator transcription factor [Paenibacillus physcomitrellae]GGA44943.1 DNA-binding response regulator [Paenibacillus physcomitrellae]